MRRYTEGLGKQCRKMAKFIPEFAEKVENSRPSRPKMVPKRSEEGHEAKAASPRRPGRPQEADSTAIGSTSKHNLEQKFERKLEKKHKKSLNV